eukprot:JP438950.1.p4 GENE.JP438950.1~~JP438950.1.p4  ORF type:complete len:50 (-),score=0.73 JP438950.1:85-234(-)
MFLRFSVGSAQAILARSAFRLCVCYPLFYCAVFHRKIGSRSMFMEIVTR